MKTLHNTRNRDHVYIIREGNKKSKNYFKIGSSKTSERLRGCQIGNPRKLHLIEKIIHANADKLEYFFHKNLIEFHHRGEWFYLNQELLLNKIKEIENSFENLNSSEIKKIKRQLSSFSERKIAKEANSISIAKRRSLAKEWAKQTQIVDNIKYAINSSRKPTLESVCLLLNGKGIQTRSGKEWKAGNLKNQIQRLGFKNLKHFINENIT